MKENSNSKINNKVKEHKHLTNETGKEQRGTPQSAKDKTKI